MEVLRKQQHIAYNTTRVNNTILLVKRVNNNILLTNRL